MRTEIHYHPDITETNKRICNRYWLRESSKKPKFVHKTKAIAQEFGLTPYDVPIIIKENSRLVMVDCKCVSCGEPDVCHTRTDFIGFKAYSNWQCEDCREAEWQKQQLIRQQQQEEAARLRQAQVREFSDYINDYREGQLACITPVSELSGVHKLMIAAVIEILGEEDLERTISLRHNFSLPLSPLMVLDKMILSRLFELHALLLVPEESFDTVTILEDGELDIDYYQSTFEFAYSQSELTEIMIYAKSQKDIHALVIDPEFELLCKNIQLTECLSQLSNRADLNSLSPTFGAKTNGMLLACLEDLPVSDMHYIIYKAVENAAAYRQKPNITHTHASNSIVGGIERIFDKINSGAWHGTKAFRNASEPQSAISRMCFDYVFREEDCGFHSTLDELFEPYRHKAVVQKTDYTTLGDAQRTNYSISGTKFNTF